MAVCKWSVLWKMGTAAICVALLTLSLVAAASSSPARPAGARSEGSAASCSQEGSALESFASEVDTIGESTFADTFGGAFISGCDEVEVWVVQGASDSGAFLDAVAADATGSSYATLAAEFSWESLAALTKELASVGSGSWQQEGLSVQRFGPDATGNRVLVSLAAPSAADLASISSEAVSLGITTAPVTSSSYTSVAGQVLSVLYGPAVSVATSYVSPAAVLSINRYTDVSPFWGGDQIERGGGASICTGGFAVVGNSSGHDFMLTAGHCGTASAWYLTGSNGGDGDGTEMGGTSTNYFGDGNYDDFQTIATLPHGSASTDPAVWGNSGSTYGVIGSTDPSSGSHMTFDGSVTGMVQGATVGGSDLCVWFDDDTVLDCNLIEGTDSSTICQLGDSGGPVFVVDGTTGDVYAVGTVVGEDDGTTCWAEMIGEEESVSNTTLQT